MEESGQHTGARLSIVWQPAAGQPDAPSAAVDHVASYAQALAKALTTAGYTPRTLEIGVRLVSVECLELSVMGDVPGVDDLVFANLASFAVAGSQLWRAMPPDSEIRLRPRLSAGPGGAASTRVAVHAPPQRAARRARGPQRIGVAPHVLVAIILGGLLGLFGIPRIGPRELPFAAAPSESTYQAPPAALEVLEAPERSIPVEAASPPPAAIVPSMIADSEPPTERTLASAAVQPRAVPRVLFAERFVSPLAGWPNNPAGVAWFESGSYTLTTRNPGRFVALAAPLAPPEGDVMLSARFRKTDGPPGGGYGFVLRDQGISTLDGQNQFGRFMVVEVGDQGDIGIWHREELRWIDLVPWTRSDAVRTGTEPNELVVTTDGPGVVVTVNGTRVAELVYYGLPDQGGVGVFIGGDQNQVALEWLRVEHPER
jgi:hypothetical protein